MQAPMLLRNVSYMQLWFTIKPSCGTGRMLRHVTGARVQLLQHACWHSLHLAEPCLFACWPH